jgi:superfamily II DNA helicase RecQ
MAYRFFTISIRDDGTAEAELNAFLASHRVLAVDRRWVEQGGDSFWSLCVDYADRAPNGRGENRRAGRGKVDYKEVLSDDDFALFARLRQVRKELAQREAVPVYTIFTNEQLSNIARQRPTSKANLEQITGIGDARVEKYGPAVLAVVGSTGDKPDAAGKPAV